MNDAFGLSVWLVAVRSPAAQKLHSRSDRTALAVPPLARVSKRLLLRTDTSIDRVSTDSAIFFAQADARDSHHDDAPAESDASCHAIEAMSDIFT